MINRNTQGSDRPAAIALIGIVIIFLAVLSRGWQGLFSGYGLFASVFLGLGVAVIATALAYAIGNEWVHQPHTKTAAWAYFFFLIQISALGTVNAAFVTFQSGNVFREEIDKATNSVVQLRDVGSNLLASPDYQRFASSVDERWKNLRAEIDNPQLCGQGAVAVRRASELQEILPSFRLLAGGGQCGNIPKLLESYDKQIASLIQASPIYAREKPKLDFKEKLQKESSGLLERLAATSKLLNSHPSVQEVKGSLFDIAEDYIQLRQELDIKVKIAKDSIPPKIDTSAVSALGDLGQIVPFLLTRLSDPSTYIYLAIAVFLDVAVIAAFARVLRSSADPRQRQAATSLKHLGS